MSHVLRKATGRQGPWRLLAATAAFVIGAGAGTASAQTVVVRNAPAGSNVEFALNTTTVATATADSTGYATLVGKPQGTPPKPEIDALLYVDTCASLRRVIVVERGQLAAPQDAGCERTPISGLFLVRPVSTIVVDVAGPNPTVLLRQGRFDPRTANVTRNWTPSPSGLVVFGGGGLARFGDVEARACGDVTECSGGGFRGTYTAGATIWFKPFLGVEGSYLKAAKSTVTGSQSNFRFDTVLDAHLVTVAGKAGVPIGPVRIYGQGGANYHWATWGTTQVVDPTTVTVDGVVRTIPGGTQTFGLRTSGWGWLVAGGLEVWLWPSVALYGEGGRAVVKGNAEDDADGRLDDSLIHFVLGARVRIGR